MPEEPNIPKEEVTEPVTIDPATDFNMEGSSTTEAVTIAANPVNTVDSPVSPTPEVPISPVVGSVSRPPTPTKKPRKKGLIIGIVLAGILALVGVSGALAYNLWYENPQKVITDAIFNAVTAKTAVYTGTISLDSNGTKVAVDISGKGDEKNQDLSAKLTVTYGGKEYKVDAAVVYVASGDIYLKASNLSDVANLIKEQLASSAQSATLNAAVDKLVAKIDGTWIKISSDDLKTYSETASTTSTCVTDVTKKYQNDSSAISEVASLYQENQFIVIKKDLGSKDGSIGYEVSGDTDKAKAFVTGLQTTKIYTALHDCDKSITLTADDLTTDATSKSTGSLQLWIDAWSHQFTKVDLTADSHEGTTVTASIKPVFGQSVTVDVPTSSTTLTQLQSDLTSIYTDALSTAN